MKRKILATAMAAIAAVTCVTGLTACGGNDGGDGSGQKTALDRAYENYYKTENMTVMVEDGRVTKYGNDFTALVEVNYATKTAYAKKYFSPEIEMRSESYYELDAAQKVLTVYQSYYHGSDDTGWEKYTRTDLFGDEVMAYYESLNEFEVHFLCNWVDMYLPTHGIQGAGWRINENDAETWVSLDMLHVFSETADGWTANVYLCIEGAPYACAVTVKLDEQERFKSYVADFGANGQITAEFYYGATTITVPEDVIANAVTQNY